MKKILFMASLSVLCVDGTFAMRKAALKARIAAQCTNMQPVTPCKTSEPSAKIAKLEENAQKTPVRIVDPDLPLVSKKPNVGNAPAELSGTVNTETGALNEEKQKEDLSDSDSTIDLPPVPEDGDEYPSSDTGSGDLGSNRADRQTVVSKKDDEARDAFKDKENNQYEDIMAVFNFSQEVFDIFLAGGAVDPNVDVENDKYNEASREYARGITNSITEDLVENATFYKNLNQKGTDLGRTKVYVLLDDLKHTVPVSFSSLTKGLQEKGEYTTHVKDEEIVITTRNIVSALSLVSLDIFNKENLEKNYRIFLSAALCLPYIKDHSDQYEECANNILTILSWMKPIDSKSYAYKFLEMAADRLPKEGQ